MRAVIQRVKNAEVIINNHEKRSIKIGLLILLGIEVTDDKDDLDWLVNKIVNMRIFNDNNGIMNHSVIDVLGSIMIVSQFTLIASTKKGNRPSYINAAKHDHAIPLYEEFINKISKSIKKQAITGDFGADMKVRLTNDGPVTIIIDSKKKE
jgi:D-tyrosyl-tRNA(Tyr) deacylase